MFNEKLKYKEESLYKDGVKLTVNTNYLVPVMKSGIVVFMGEKETIEYDGVRATPDHKVYISDTESCSLEEAMLNKVHLYEGLYDIV